MTYLIATEKRSILLTYNGFSDPFRSFPSFQMFWKNKSSTSFNVLQPFQVKNLGALVTCNFRSITVHECIISQTLKLSEPKPINSHQNTQAFEFRFCASHLHYHCLYHFRGPCPRHICARSFSTDFGQNHWGHSIETTLFAQFQHSQN